MVPSACSALGFLFVDIQWSWLPCLTSLAVTEIFFGVGGFSQHSDLKIMQDLSDGFPGAKRLLVPWKWLVGWHSVQNPAAELGYRGIKVASGTLYLWSHTTNL